ncbi:MAG TPA: acyltransferase [Nitrospira sp.]|nr:acyltransferase [Nitrospira sp.]
METRHKSMDLLRAAAILLVILAHTVLSYGAPPSLAPLQFGGSGVDLFFVLSGWLLGGQLFKELVRDGRVDVRRFWIRRWMRTLPAYYSVLLLSVIQRYITKDNVNFPWQYFVFVQNYDFPLQFFSISWSLCVEEQFYLLIAPIVALSVSFGPKRTTSILIAMLVLPLLFRSLGWYGYTEETHVRIDCCVVGVLLAYAQRCYPLVWSILTKYAKWAAAVALIGYVLVYVSRYQEWSYVANPDKLLLAAIFASWVILANASREWRETLYFPGAYHVATRSYALYLVHPEVLALLKRLSTTIPFPIYLSLAVAGSLLVAEMLYRFIEKPFMDARENYGLSKTT